MTEGPVTIQLVVVCFAVCSVALAAFGYVVQRFQTKEDAKSTEESLTTWIQRLENDVTSVQNSLERIGNDVSYIRGRLEPNTKQ